MSGGTTATTQYPASVLGGLWSGVNNAFPATPYGNNQAASNNAYNVISGLNMTGGQGVPEAFGYNPGLTASGANNLSQLSSNLPGIATGQYGALTGAGQQANQQLSGIAGQTIPAAQGLLGQYQSGAPSLLSSYLPGAEASMGTNNQYAQQALQTGFDPQKALFNQQFGQQQQQNLAAQAGAGVATTPYGAGLTEQGNQNFDIAWQQSQLAREQAGAGTAASLYGANANTASTGNSLLNSLLSGAQGLYGTGANALTGGAGALGSLYGTGTSGISSLLGAGANQLSQAGSAINPAQTQIQDYLNYLGGSSGNAMDWASAVANMYAAATGQYSAANQAQNNQANINAQGLGGLGTGLGNIAGLFAGGY